MLLCTAILALTAFIALTFYKKPGFPTSRTVTIESEAPGSEIYLDGKSLGTTPCVLSESRLKEEGLAWPENDDNLKTFWHSWWLDPFGIILQPKRDVPSWRKLFFKPPADVAAKYLTAETPWGTMVVAGPLSTGGPGNNWTFHLNYMATQTTDGFSLEAMMPDSTAKPGGPCHVTLLCRNNTGKLLTTFRPQAEIYCSKFDEPAMWRMAAMGTPPDSWGTFDPGATNTATFDFDAPTPGDYCVFAFAYFYKEPDGQAIYDAIYSNGLLLRVRK